MVPFVSVDNMMQIVNALGMEATLFELASYIEEDFRRWEQFDKIPRIASYSEDGVIELMPTCDGMIYGFKYVNGHPKNASRGYQTVTAFGLLAELSSGYPVLLSEMTILTALRTAATSAMAAKYLAPKGSNTMAIIGNGAQCEFQVLAFKTVLGIDTVKLYDVDVAVTAKAIRNLADRDVHVIPCNSSQEAIAGAQIITTCSASKQNALILTDDMVSDGVHINAIGGDCPGKTELQRDILLRSDIFVEFAPQTRIEGEIQQLDEDHAVTEIWQVIDGSFEGRKSDDQITLFDSVGFAIEDFSVLRFIRSQLSDTGQYANLDMLADPDDPRDLFGMIMRSA